MEERIHVSDLRPDENNARTHTPQGVGMIVDALQEIGAARSIVIDESNEIMAGNATVDAAIEAQMTDVIVVDAEGDELIAVRRTGLTPDQKTRLALFDNRTAEFSSWDSRELGGLDSELTHGIFAGPELEALTREGGSGLDVVRDVMDPTEAEIKVGPFHFTVPISDFETWLGYAGNEPEIRRRLGMNPPTAEVE